MLKITILNCGNRIFLNFLLICPKKIRLILVSSNYLSSLEIDKTHKFWQKFTINLKKLMAYIATYFQTQFKGCIIFAQIRSKLSILPQKRYFAKLTVFIVYLLYTFILQHLKNIHKEQIIRQKVPHWAHINPKGDFWKNE